MGKQTTKCPHCGCWFPRNCYQQHVTACKRRSAGTTLLWSMDIPTKLHRRLRDACVAAGITLREGVELAIRSWLKKDRT